MPISFLTFFTCVTYHILFIACFPRDLQQNTTPRDQVFQDLVLRTSGRIDLLIFYFFFLFFCWDMTGVIGELSGLLFWNGLFRSGSRGWMKGCFEGWRGGREGLWGVLLSFWDLRWGWGVCRFNRFLEPRVGDDGPGDLVVFGGKGLFWDDFYVSSIEDRRKVGVKKTMNSNPLWFSTHSQWWLLSSISLPDHDIRC